MVLLKFQLMKQDNIFSINTKNKTFCVKIYDDKLQGISYINPRKNQTNLPNLVDFDESAWYENEYPQIDDGLGLNNIPNVPPIPNVPNNFYPNESQVIRASEDYPNESQVMGNGDEHNS